MSEFRTDPLFGTLSLIARERADRPRRIRVRGERLSSGPCPLCPGNENLAPPEIARIEHEGKWLTRAFPNRYPSVSLEAQPAPIDLKPPAGQSFRQQSPGGQTSAGDSPEMFSNFPGFGAHEMIVDSQSHTFPFWALDPESSVRVLTLLQRRVEDLYLDRRLVYAQIFKNHGTASGGSLEHPHFQLVALPFIPEQVRTLMAPQQRCKVCALLSHELSHTTPRKPPPRLLTETLHFVALADFAPSYAYQFSIYPKKHQSRFESATLEEILDFSQMCTLSLGRFERMFGELSINLVLYTQPNPGAYDVAPDAVNKWESGMHWFVRIFPRSGRHAGFELATGISVVHVPPEDVTKSFREKGV